MGSLANKDRICVSEIVKLKVCFRRSRLGSHVSATGPEKRFTVIDLSRDDVKLETLWSLASDVQVAAQKLQEMNPIFRACGSCSGTSW